MTGNNNNVLETLSTIAKFSTQEFCENETDIVQAETTHRIFNAVGNKLKTGKKLLEQREVDIALALYIKVFIKKSPITAKERHELRTFLSNENALVIGNAILSKLSLQQSDDNKEFIRSFLEAEVGKYDGTKFIQYLLHELGNYPLVADVTISGQEGLTTLNRAEGTGVLCSYMDFYGKYKLLLMQGNEVVYFSEEFEKKPELLHNGLLSCVEIRGKRENGEWTKIGTNPKKDVGGEHSEVWVLYELNTETNKLVQVYLKESIVGMDALNGAPELFRTTDKQGKKGVIKAVKTDIGEWKISEILQELYDRVRMGGTGFIVAEDDNEIDKNTTVGIHVVSPDEFKAGEEIGRTLLGKITNLQQKHAITFHDDVNICAVHTLTGYNWYSIDREHQSLTPIEGLQGTKYFSSNFFLGSPELIEEKGKLAVKMFDRESRTVRNLVEIESNIYPCIDMRHNVIQLSFYGVGTGYFHLREGRLYKAKKGFQIIRGNIYKNWLFLTKYTGVSVFDSFERIHEYLEEINAPARIIIDNKNGKIL